MMDIVWRVAIRQRCSTSHRLHRIVIRIRSGRTNEYGMCNTVNGSVRRRRQGTCDGIVAISYYKRSVMMDAMRYALTET